MSVREMLIADILAPKSDLYCITKHRRGNILWSLWEDSKTGNKVIQCDFIKLDKETHVWYTETSYESDNQIYFTCPIKYLDLSTPISPKWRETVVELFNSRKNVWTSIKTEFKMLKKKKMDKRVLVHFPSDAIIPNGIVECVYPLIVRYKGIPYNRIPTDCIISYEVVDYKTPISNLTAP